MGRIARVVLPGIPHHVTQRGVRSMPIFSSDNDRLDYLHLLAKQGQKHGLTFLAWCLMSNHVHLIAVPEETHSLSRGIGEAHRQYTRLINFRDGVRGYFFQGRFFSCPLDRKRLLAAARYILRNPVRAGLVAKSGDYLWSSARWYLGMASQDLLVNDLGPLAEIDVWEDFLANDPEDIDILREHTRTGRPCGTATFITRAERITGRALKKRKPGRKPKRTK